MGSITLTNISQFIEQPGRSIIRTLGALDRMTIRFLGPWYAEAPFTEGTRDSIYPLMFCTGFTENYNGALKELTVNYAGRTDNDWQKDILVTIAGSEKELSYSVLTTFASNPITASTGGIFSSTGTIPDVTYGLNQFCLHYVGEIITYKYVYYGTPMQRIANNAKVLSQYSIHTGKGSTVTIVGTPLSGFLQEQFPGPYGYSGPHQRLTQFTFQQVIDQWYECQSATEARYEVP